MDTSEYLPLFIAECRENLEELTNAIVRLEENPSDHETLDAVFRIAHSLKGMSATMGFDGMAKLTHQMEDVLELIRQRGSGLPRDAINVLLACLDALSGSVEAIEADGSEQLDARELIEKLSVLVRGQDEPREAAKPPVAAAPPVGGVRVSFVPGTSMPSVRAFQVLTLLAEHCEVRHSSPSLDQVDDFAGDEVVADVVCANPDELALALRRITDVADVTVADTEPPEAPQVQAAPELQAVESPPAGSDRGSDKPKTGSAGRATATVRVDAARLDQLMHMTGEMAIKLNQVEAFTQDVEDADLQQAVYELTRTSQELQEMVMRIRMIPIETVFLRFPRLVRDVAATLGKDVELSVDGQDTELDRTVVDAIGDPLVHLIRNALDHGIESPEERAAAGKPAQATLAISARQHGGLIVITVADDGRGVDPELVGRRAVQRNLITAAEAQDLDRAGAIELLFTPGFSTAQDVGDVSGRGVGMDAVRNRIRKLGGEVIVRSKVGFGTQAQIRLPLTLAVLPALLVDVQGTIYGFHLQRVERALRLQGLTIRSAGGAPVLLLDDKPIPLIHSAELFGHEQVAADTDVVILNGRDGNVALTVSGLAGRRDLVTRALPSAAADSDLLSGAAVLPSGEIVLIADCDSTLMLPTRQQTASAEAA